MNTDTPTAQRVRSPLLTADRAAEYLSIAKSTLNRYRREGRIKATYICSDARYHIDDLDAFIEAARNCEGPAV